MSSRTRVIERKFFDPTNLEPLCAPHHDSDAQQEERLG
jgi:hypothetical protein